MPAINSIKFPSGRSVANCRKDAKRLAKQNGIPLHRAQYQIAVINGLDMPWDKAISLLSNNLTTENQIQTNTLPQIMARADIQAVLKEHPYLTHYGIGIPRRRGGWGSNAEDVDAEYKNQQDQLLEAIEECNKACYFLRFTEKRKSVNDRGSSYGLKHEAEFLMKRLPWQDNYYVANGSFICAALYLGYEYKQGLNDSPNVVFNISSKSPIFKWRTLHERTYPTVKNMEELYRLETLLGVGHKYPELAVGS